MKAKDIPVMPQMCGTCPWRDGSPYWRLTEDLGISALSRASRICHSTGTSGILGRTGKPDRICRGARDLQLRFFCAIGFIEAPTDEAWDKKRKELGV